MYTNANMFDSCGQQLTSCLPGAEASILPSLPPCIAIWACIRHYSKSKTRDVQCTDVHADYLYYSCWHTFSTVVLTSLINFFFILVTSDV